MEKRQFLTSTAGLLIGSLAGLINSARAVNHKQKNAQTILTITGEIERTNRKKMDPVKDQLMHKQGIQFTNAYTFTLADIEKFSSKTIKPTMEYDQRVHELSGPLLMDVLNAVGIKKKSQETSIVLHGIDGYSPEISLEKAQQYQFILATAIDGQLLSIGGFGPLFAIYDADRIEELAKKPIEQRFFACPWGLYCIEVKTA